MPLKAKDSLGLLRGKRSGLNGFKATDDSHKSRLPAIKPTNATDELKWQIKALPSDWVPNTKPSNVVANLMKKKQAEHYESLKMMKDKMVKVNIELEQDIRLRSELMKEKLEEFRRDFDDAMKSIDLPDDISTITIAKETFHEIMEVINAAIGSSLGEVMELHDFLLQLEKGRSEKFKVILRDAYEEMLGISYKLPYQLQTFFEKEILNINQITLSNYRAYEELKMQIMLKLENDRRLWIQSLFNRKDDYVNRKKAFLNEMSKGRQSTSFDVFELTTPMMKLSINDKCGNSLNIDTFILLSQTLAKFLTCFDVDVKIMKNLTESTIQKIYLSNYDQVQHINLDLNNIHSDYDLMELKDAILKTFFDSSNLLNDFSIEMMTKWEEFKGKIQTELLENVRIFTSAIHLWDEHFVRLFELKELTIIDLRKLIEKNRHSEDAQLCKNNVLMDQLRQASSEAELTQLMAEIKKCLGSIMKITDSNLKKEIAFFNKYKSLAEKEASIFLSEIDVFLEHYSKNSDVDPTMQRGRASWMKICIKEETPTIILDFQNVTKSLKNWIFGLQDTIKVSMEKYQSDFMKSAETWINNQCINLHRKFEIKNVMYKPKFQRIYEYIYKIRLAELKQHEERLERHKLGIKAEIDRLKEVSVMKQSAFEETVDEFAQQLPDYITKLAKMKTSLGVEGLIIHLKNLKIKHANKMEETKDSFLTIVEDTLSDIRIVNLDYMKCLKLFNEGGNYTPGEVKKFKGLFKKISKKLNKDVRPIEKQLNQKITKGFNLLDVKETPFMNELIQCKDELQFHEYTISEIRNVRAKIKEVTYNLKYKYKIIEQLFCHLTEAANNNIGSLGYLEEFVQNCEYLEGAFHEVRLLLVQENPFKLNPRLFRDDGLVSASTMRSTLAEILAGDDLQFNMVLFESVDEGNDYIGSVVGILYASLSEVQSKAKEFYGKYANFLKRVTIPDIKTYMLEILCKYLYYELQCEEVWLEIAVEYSIRIEDVLEFIREYYVNSIRRYVDIQSEQLKKKCFEYMSKINKQNDNVDERYKELHKKLKPLLGHPKNKSLVQELEAQREELNAHVLEAQDEILTTFEEIKEEVQKNLETFEENLLEAENKLKTNMDGYITLVVEDGSLLQLIRSRIEYLGSVISSDYYSCDNSEKYSNIIVELNKKLNELKKGLKITSESLLKFSNSISSVKKAVDDMSYISSEVGTISNSSIRVLELIELYRQQQEFCLSKIDFSKDLSVTSKNWNDQWENDLKNIQNLYRVKYCNK